LPGMGSRTPYSRPRQRPVIKKNLKFKFKSTYFKCHSGYILFSVLTTNSLTSTASVTDGCYGTFQKLKKAKEFFPA